MDQQKFQDLLRYYLSCMDAEQAAQLRLRKNQECQTHIWPNKGLSEQLFSQGLAELVVDLSDAQEKKFILERSADKESLVDLHYGFPVLKDKKDMISPLFFVRLRRSFPTIKRFVSFPR